MGIMNPLIWGPGVHGRLDVTLSAFPAATNTIQLNDANNAMAGAFAIPLDGNIDQIGFLHTATVGSPPDYNAALVDLDAAGAPTGAAYGGSAIETWTPAGTGFVWVTLDPVAVVNAGDILAVEVWPTGSAPDGGNNVTLGRDLRGLSSILPLGMAYTTLWSRYAYRPCVAIRYSTATYYGWPATGWWGFNFDQADTPDEVGMKITLPACKCVGAKITNTYMGGNASITVNLYNSVSTLLASWALSDEDKLQTTQGEFYARWDEQTLLAGDYYLTVASTHATATIAIAGLQFPSAALRAAAALHGAGEVVAAYRTDAGAWTEDNTVLPSLALLLSEITAGGAAGGAKWL